MIPFSSVLEMNLWMTFAIDLRRIIHCLIISRMKMLDDLTDVVKSLTLFGQQ